MVLDYVVAGFGIGALFALVGFALWELFGGNEESQNHWLSRTAIGLMIGALVIWAVTGVTLISALDDATGSRLVFLTTLITLVANVAGSLWYRRLDQSLVQPMRPAARVNLDAVATAVAAPRALSDVELSEWDSWPERDMSDAASENDTAEALTPSKVSFEPEVAVAAVLPVSEESPTPALPFIEQQPVEAVEQEDTQETNVDQASDDPLDTVKDAIQTVELPINIRPFQPPVVAEPESVDQVVDLEIEKIEATADEPVVDASDGTGVETPEDDPVGAPPSDGGAGPEGFESALLADIDVDEADGNGRYQSPLLADLESNPDELEGLGLAKWRPEDRLTAEDSVEESLPLAKKRQR